MEINLALVSSRLQSLLQERHEHPVLTTRSCAILLEDAEGEEKRLGQVVPAGGGDEEVDEKAGPRLIKEETELDHFISPENLVLYYTILQHPAATSPLPSPPPSQPAGLNPKKNGTTPTKATHLSRKTAAAQATDNDFDAAKQSDNHTLSPMPLKPYYLDLAKVLSIWATTGEFPISFVSMEGQGLLANVDNVSPMRALTPVVLETFHKFNSTADANVQQALLHDLLEKMGLRGILTCLRLRQTFKSVEDFPPSCERLIQALNAPHASSSPSTRITVGGRALSKHGHRAADGWWGTSSGAEEVKNKNAERVTRKIFSQAAWINLHMLPHDIATYEVRTKEGYGARWTISKEGAVEFRGFIEPQMEDGHDKKWRH